MGYTNEKLNLPFGIPSNCLNSWSLCNLCICIFSEWVPLKFFYVNKLTTLTLLLMAWVNEIWWSKQGRNFEFKSSVPNIDSKECHLAFPRRKWYLLEVHKKITIYYVNLRYLRYFLICCTVSESCINILSVFESCFLVMERTLAWILFSLVKDTWRYIFLSASNMWAFVMHLSLPFLSSLGQVL